MQAPGTGGEHAARLGIGPALAKEIVERHGGWIAASRDGPERSPGSNGTAAARAAFLIPARATDGAGATAGRDTRRNHR